MVSAIDFHLHLKLIVIEYVLEILYNFVFVMNHLVVQNIGIVTINKIIDLIVFQEQYLILIFKRFLIQNRQRDYIKSKIHSFI